jgi:hypothetical protein
VQADAKVQAAKPFFGPIHGADAIAQIQRELASLLQPELPFSFVPELFSRSTRNRVHLTRESPP